MSKGRLVAPKQVRQKHLGVASRILRGAGQASASRLQCLTGGGRHSCHSGGFSLETLGLVVCGERVDRRLKPAFHHLGKLVVGQTDAVVR